MTNNYVRGAVSGLGVVNVVAALAELADLFTKRASGPDAPEDDVRITDRG